MSTNSTPATGKMTARSRFVVSRTSAYAMLCPPTSTLLPAGAAGRAASRSGPETRSSAAGSNGVGPRISGRLTVRPSA